jgi:peptide/nickel transport system substrate-binding protein
MKRLRAAAIALAGAGVAAADARRCVGPARATADHGPAPQNESMTNMMNGEVYERLTSRDRQLKIVPGLATECSRSAAGRGAGCAR